MVFGRRCISEVLLFTLLCLSADALESDAHARYSPVLRQSLAEADEYEKVIETDTSTSALREILFE